jgi:outer membrane protein OmpA-like peptidoglycan-associated protein
MWGICQLSARLGILLLFSGFLAGQSQQWQHINIQVSDTSAHPVIGLEITTQGPGVTARTDSAGKATIAFLPTTGAIKLVIVSPKGLDFASPWDRTVTLPPDFWSITVMSHGNRKALENVKVLSALTAAILQLQARRTLSSPPPSPVTREKAISAVAEQLGLESRDVENSINEWGTKAPDAYSRALFSMFNFSYEKAAGLFSDTLASLKDSTAPNDVQTATDAAVLLAESSFEKGDYRASVDAYAIASRLRPTDPSIVSGSQLSAEMLEKSGGDKDVKEAQSPLKPPSREDFWGSLNPFERKEYGNTQPSSSSDRSNELDQLTQDAAKSIKDVDERAQQGIKLASDKAVAADQHAIDAGSKESKGQESAQAANRRVESLESVVANIDQYTPSKEIEIRFKSRKALLSKNAKETLDEMATTLKGQRGYIIEVRGIPADSDAEGMAHSQKMTESVVRYLVLNHEIPVYRIYLIDSGKTSGAAEKTKGSQGAGRVEIVLLKNDLEQISEP